MNARINSFEEALRDARSKGPSPHVLLGNGFSIACRPDCFSYPVLRREADFSDLSIDSEELFRILGTDDFERVIDVLRTSALLAPLYAASGIPAAQMETDADVIKNALANVLAAKHPDVPSELPDAEYVRARTFLASFDRIYTLNYDMLLYWALMQDMEPRPSRNDGFGAPEDEEAAYVVWEPYNDYGSQRVFYLHGGLHLYDRGTELDKITWCRTGIPLVTQIREALDTDRYPLIVTEGTSKEKLEKILHNAYLNHAIRSFSKIRGSLFVYGHSLAANDEHVLNRIAKGKIARLYVSLYGDPQSEANTSVISNAERLASGRPKNAPLSVSFFDAESAHVWR